MAASVILVHGLGGSAAEWRAVVDALESSGHTVVTPELPGHGSRAVDPFRVGPAVGGILEAVDSCSARPLLVGRELGGHLALQAAAVAGTGVAMVAAAGIGTEVLGWVLDSYRRADAAAALLPDGGAAVDAWAGDAVLDRGSARAAGSRILGPALEDLARIDTLAVLRGLGAPFVLLNGSRDRFRLQERALLRAARSGRRERVRGERFAERIADATGFARRVAGLAGACPDLE